MSYSFSLCVQGMYITKTSGWLKQTVGKLDEVKIGQKCCGLFFFNNSALFQVIFSYLGHQSPVQLQKKVMMMIGHLIE